MKKFDEASIYFEKLLKYPNFNEDKYLLSILYSTDLTKKEEIESLKMKFNEHIKDQDKKFFYTNLLYCLDDFHLCKKNYD
jgi:hypothetical protein